MSIITVIYCLLMASLIYSRSNLRDTDVDFPSSDTAKGYAMVATERYMANISILYVIVIYLLLLF